ncbi:MAG: hypothetical protein MUC47_11810 [Candidatus Kapabacteria bacterium]|nr:hypothetical protein [Candidatus Kapabacteria bacterium]
MNRLVMALLAASWTSSMALAQGVTEEDQIERIRLNDLNVQVGMSFQVVNPQGTFRDALQTIGAPEVGYGFTVGAAYHMSPIPVAFGLEGGVVFMGGDSREQTMQNGLFRDTILQETQTSIVPIMLSMRFQPNIATWVFPYVEVVGGANIHLASYTLTQTNAHQGCRHHILAERPTAYHHRHAIPLPMGFRRRSIVGAYESQQQ